RVSQLKGIEPLVRAFAQLAAQHPQARLVIAGPGDGEEVRLTKLIEELHLSARITLVGAVPGRECWQALMEADLFALTSFTEGLPNAVLEALATGLPVLITDACNLPEVAEYDAGRVVAPTVEAITPALHEMLSDTELRKSMSQNARRLIAERFEISRVVDQLEALYFGLANNHQQSLTP
ncbi:MAG TPA: glycosyltransferase, partial [Pirellulaceae bacterium]|nr:glycosyltransferase [Pirellulaceae bacterium]